MYDIVTNSSLITNYRKTRQARENELYWQIYATSGSSAQIVGRRARNSELRVADHVRLAVVPNTDTLSAKSMKCANQYQTMLFLVCVD